MIKLEKTDVFGWESAIRGMRNPMNSWDKSDSGFCEDLHGYRVETGEHITCDCTDPEGCSVSDCKRFIIGQNDLKLMKNLSKAGNDHAKFLRMINVTVDITAPLYWWKEFDTYKVGTVANSCSTMHKIHEKEFTLDDFSCENLDGHDLIVDMCPLADKSVLVSPRGSLNLTIKMLNFCRDKYNETKTKPMKEEGKRKELLKVYFDQMIQLLPSSYNQKRTIQLNYQVLKSMYHARKNHKLDEWREFCKWCETLPYFKEVCIDV